MEKSMFRMMYNLGVNAMKIIPDDDFIRVGNDSNIYVISVDDVEARAEKEEDIMQCLTGAESVGRMTLEELADVNKEINLQIFAVGEGANYELKGLGIESTSVDNLKSIKPGDFILMGKILELVVPELDPSLEVDRLPDIMKNDEIYYVKDMAPVFEKIPEKCFERIGSVTDYKKILALGETCYFPWAVDDFCPEWIPRSYLVRLEFDSFIQDLDCDIVCECIIISGDNVYTYYGEDWEF